MSNTKLSDLKWTVANWALASGLKEKDVVALMMDNRPEFIFMWYVQS